MCGIAGILNLKGDKIDPIILRDMCDIQKHRGPDDEGYVFIDTKAGLIEERQGINTVVDVRTDKIIIEEENRRGYNLGLGHRRLSIIDLSSFGHQPMCNEDGSIWIVYNGEVYNYREIMDFLKGKGHVFRSKTDTETIIHLYEEKKEKCLNDLNGMFSFCLWDSKSKKLFCARDRFGIKPLHYFFNGEKFVFASEIKAIFQDEKINRIPNDEVIYKYLNNDFVPGQTDTFYEGIKQVPPAHYLTVENGVLTVQKYWEVPLGTAYSKGSYDDTVKTFFDLFKDSVRLRLQSDVPVGTCLSGGLDSSSVACVINGLLKDQKINYSQKSFSSCFENKLFDERDYIDLVVKKTGVNNYCVFPEGKTLFKTLPDLIRHQDEPFSGTSIFAQWEVMKLAKNSGVKVILDGQGGDETLAGYHHYYKFLFAGLLKKIKIVKLLKEAILFSKQDKYPVRKSLYEAAKININPAVKNILKKLLNKEKKPYEWLNTEQNTHGRKKRGKRHKEFLKNELLNSLTGYLPSLLRYEDRNSMAHSVEARLPFLDYRLVEFVFGLPDDFKINNGLTKAILRDAMKNVLPEEVRLRKDKMGFVTPEKIWFKTTLKEEIKDIIYSESFQNRKYFKGGLIKKEFEDYCNDKKEITGIVWRWVNFELWYRICIEKNIKGL